MIQITPVKKEKLKHCRLSPKVQKLLSEIQNKSIPKTPENIESKCEGIEKKIEALKESLPPELVIQYQHSKPLPTIKMMNEVNTLLRENLAAEKEIKAGEESNERLEKEIAESKRKFNEEIVALKMKLQNSFVSSVSNVSKSEKTSPLKSSKHSADDEQLEREIDLQQRKNNQENRFISLLLDEIIMMNFKDLTSPKRLDTSLNKILKRMAKERTDSERQLRSQLSRLQGREVLQELQMNPVVKAKPSSGLESRLLELELQLEEVKTHYWHLEKEEQTLENEVHFMKTQEDLESMISEAKSENSTRIMELERQIKRLEKKTPKFNLTEFSKLDFFFSPHLNK